VGFIPVLRVSPADAGVVLSWDGSFSLQSASNAAGPYADWPRATSPFIHVPDPNAPQRFFRLRVSDPVLTDPRRTTDGFCVELAGSPGRRYAVLASTNLVDWMPLEAGVSPFAVQDSNAAAGSQRFYRAVLLAP